MKPSKYLLPALLVCAALPQAGLANKVIQQATGTVTSPLVGHTISIDGRVYTVPGSGPNLDALAALNTGDQVQMGFTGSSATHNLRVLSITPHQSK